MCFSGSPEFISCPAFMLSSLTFIYCGFIVYKTPFNSVLKSAVYTEDGGYYLVILKWSEGGCENVYVIFIQLVVNSLRKVYSM